MDTLQAIYTRKTIRKFSEKDVEWDKVVEILDAGRNAPSAGNLQPAKFIVVTDQEKKRELADASLQQWWMEAAPVLIVVAADLERVKQFYGPRGVELYSIQDCAAAMQNMILAATDLGIGTAWVSAFDEKMVYRAMDIPEDTARPLSILCLGYSSEEPKEQIKFPLTTAVFLEKWGNRVRDPLRMYLGQYSHIWESKIDNGIKAMQSATEAVREKIKEFGKKFLSKSEKPEPEKELAGPLHKKKK